MPADRGLGAGADLVAVAGAEAVTSGGEPPAVQGEAGHEEGGLGVEGLDNTGRAEETRGGVGNCGPI